MTGKSILYTEFFTFTIAFSALSNHVRLSQLFWGVFPFHSPLDVWLVDKDTTNDKQEDPQIHVERLAGESKSSKFPDLIPILPIFYIYL